MDNFITVTEGNIYDKSVEAELKRISSAITDIVDKKLKELNMTKSALAKKVKVSHTAIQKFMNGESLALKMILKIERVLKIKLINFLI